MGRKSSKSAVTVMLRQELLDRLDEHRRQRAASGLTETVSRSEWIAVAIVKRLAAEITNAA